MVEEFCEEQFSKKRRLLPVSSLLWIDALKVNPPNEDTAASSAPVRSSLPVESLVSPPQSRPIEDDNEVAPSSPQTQGPDSSKDTQICESGTSTSSASTSRCFQPVLHQLSLQSPQVRFEGYHLSGITQQRQQQSQQRFEQHRSVSSAWFSGELIQQRQQQELMLSLQRQQQQQQQQQQHVDYLFSMLQQNKQLQQQQPQFHQFFFPKSLNQDPKPQRVFQESLGPRPVPVKTSSLESLITASMRGSPEGSLSDENVKSKRSLPEECIRLSLHTRVRACEACRKLKKKCWHRH